MSEQAVVLGAAGFIGAEIARRLEAGGVEVKGYTRTDCDLLDRTQVAAQVGPALAGATLVCAAGKHRQYGDDLDFYQQNIAAVANVLAAAEANLPTRIVFLSTMEVYGTVVGNGRITESTPPAPTYLYAAGKVAQEYLIRTWAHQRAVSCTMLRLPGIYGANDRRTSIVSKLFHLACQGGSFNLVTDGNELRDYVAVAELAACVEQLVAAAEVPGVLNVGSGVSVSINDLLQLVERVSGKQIEVARAAVPKPGFDIVVDDSLLRRTLETWPFSSLESGLRYYADSLR